jgi:hypothetical protein
LEQHALRKRRTLIFLTGIAGDAAADIGIDVQRIGLGQ